MVLSDLDCELVDLLGRMASAPMDAHDRGTRWARGEAEDLAAHRVEPGMLEVDALVGLDREVALVRLPQLMTRHPDEAGVDVHEPGHSNPRRAFRSKFVGGRRARHRVDDRWATNPSGEGGNRPGGTLS